MAYRGKFRPSNSHKYKGDHTKIIYRSLWELKFMRKCDENTGIVQWSSEEIIVPYRSLIDGKKHRYFPDFWVKKLNSDVVLVEIKPMNQSVPPQKKSKVTKRYLEEVKTWGTNLSKWRAAQEYCDDRGWTFMVLTEKGEARRWRQYLTNSY